MTDSVRSLEERLALLEERFEELSHDAAISTDLDIIWVIVSAVLVFFMQVGFAMLEVGSVHPKNTKAVLLKNIGDASLGALCWWLVGFALAYGEDAHGLTGTDMFALRGPGSFDTPGFKEAEWMFDWAFAATSVTIVSGAIAERVKIAAYVMYAVILTSFIYPLVVHWAWQSDGWASPYRMPGDGARLLAGCGAADFAGSGVVHMVGGTAALVAAVAVKPRVGRFRNGQVCRLLQQSPALQTLGTLILWVGWYAFNAGSSVTVSHGRSVVAARAVVSTTIAPSAAVLVMVVSLKILEKKFDTRGVNNGILSGLVAITAGAPLVDPEGAFVIGVVSAGVYYYSASWLLKLRIDDVVDAAPVHLFCGIWGMFATGLFATREGWELTYGERGGDRADECCGLFYGCGFNLLFANWALLIAILAWVGGASTILFFGIEATVGLRVPANEEQYGMDRTRHNSFGSNGSYGTGKQGGMDAVSRAYAKVHLGVEDAFYIAGANRSQQTSRSASLTSSKHGDMAGGAGPHGNVKQELAWGGGHAFDSRLEQRVGPTPQVFGRPSRVNREELLHYREADGGDSSADNSDAVTPSVGRGSARFQGHFGHFGAGGGDGGFEHGTGSRNERGQGNGMCNGYRVYLGAPQAAPASSPSRADGEMGSTAAPRASKEANGRQEEKMPDDVAQA